MIELTKLNGQAFMLGAELIETIEEVPDTVITTTTDSKYIVRESAQEVKKQIIEYKQKIFSVLKG